MNVCENEAVIAFDTLYTQNHIQILKILLPYFDPYGQNHLAVWIKYLELRYTLEYVSRHPSPPYKNQTSGTSSPDFAVLFEQIKNFCSPQEKALFGELLNLQKNLEMFEEMKGMMQLFETLRENAPDANADTAAASPTGNGAFPGNFDPMTFLKGMLSPEQEAMFEAFRDGL